MTSGSRARVALAWVFVFVAASVWLAAIDYHTQDPDSLLYARIAAELSERPLVSWIAPQWPAGWYGTGLFRDHPAGLFILPALIARLGYPAEQAAYVVNAAYQILALLLLPIVANSFASSVESGRLAWVLQLVPLAFVYRIRANHEGALLLLFVLAILGTEKSRDAALWSLVNTLALAATLLIKGLVVLPVFLCCALWLVARSRVDGKRAVSAWLGLGLSGAALLMTAWCYEVAYARVTGASFLGPYLGRATQTDPHRASILGDPLYNLIWYAGRMMWLAAPWSVAALWAVRSGTRGSNAAAKSSALFSLGVAAIYLTLFSFGGRRAERYLFPAYFAVSAFGAVVAMRRSRRLAAWLERADSPYTPVLTWAVTFAIHILGGALHLPRLKLWKADA